MFLVFLIKLFTRSPKLQKITFYRLDISGSSESSPFIHVYIVVSCYHVSYNVHFYYEFMDVFLFKSPCVKNQADKVSMTAA